MPRFEPFAGLRYASDGDDIDDLVCPPYDVIGAEERARLAARDQANAVHIEIPQDPGGGDRYEHGAEVLRGWVADGTLVRDGSPAFYGYAMTFGTEGGGRRRTLGVLGCLGVEEPGTGDVLPHERTIAKDRADRLSLLQASRANLSPIWGLSMSGGLAALCEPEGPPDARATDDDGVVHELWVFDDPRRVEAIAAEVASAPVVIADGHHRYEVAHEYLRAHPADPGAASILAFVVELAPDQLDVRPIHRLLSGLPDGLDITAAFGEHFELRAIEGGDGHLLSAMEDEGGLGLLTSAGRWLLVPTAATDAAAEHDLDTSRIDVARATLPPHEVVFQAGLSPVRQALDAGRAQAAVLVRPVTVAQIHATGAKRERMPQKSTYFWPKPRTGMVFRTLD